jgi:pimeloyl-ACP methyl ester carboxylesterase
MSIYVLVHGSWHGAWCWYKVAARLRAARHTVIVPDMPGHGRDWHPPGSLTMQDYVDTLTAILDAAAEPVVLVVHSRNGIVASQAAEARPDRIRKLVYLASYLAPIGDTPALAQSRDGWARDPDSLLWARQGVVVDRKGGWDMLKRDVFREALYADCSEDDIALAYALLTPEPRGPNSPTETPLRTTAGNFGRIPRIYIELTQDRAVSWGAQKRMYQATPCERVLTIEASHSAYFSQPDQLAKQILVAGDDWIDADTEARAPIRPPLGA